MTDLQTLLLSDRPLWITENAYRRMMVCAFPIDGAAPTEDKKTEPIISHEKIRDFLKSHSWYQLECHVAFVEIKYHLGKCEETKDINLTDEFASPELKENTVAYHRVYGLITAESQWYFSSKQLQQDFVDAENNPNISVHLLHINSPGGEAWYMDRLSETLRSAKKPVIAIYEGCCASAAYYIGCHASKLYATTDHDFVGCIGTMCSFWDFEPYFEKLGIKKVTAKASNSQLKNKVFDDLREGKPKQYIQNVLDPMNEQFLGEVKAMRPKLAELDDDAPVLQGESFYTSQAEEVGLIDGKRTFYEAVAEAASLGDAYMGAQRLYGCAK